MLLIKNLKEQSYQYSLTGHPLILLASKAPETYDCHIMNVRTKEENMRQVSLTITTSPEIKGMLEKIAWEEFRTLSGQVEMIFVQWLEANGHLKKEGKKLSSVA